MTQACFMKMAFCERPSHRGYGYSGTNEKGRGQPLFITA
jgi:hypothetical protein